MDSWSIRRSAASCLACGVIVSGVLFRKSVSLISRSMSLSLTTCFPTITAMRSSTTALDAAVTRNRAMQVRRRISKGLPNGEEELEMSGVLLSGLTVAWRLGAREARVALQQLHRRPAEAYERRWVDAVSQIEADRADRRTVADSEAYRLHRIIEILQVFLAEAQRQIPDRAVDVAHVVKEHALYVVADERKAHLDVIDEQSISAQREAGGRAGHAAGNKRGPKVERPRLVVRECAQGVRASRKEPLRQGNGFSGTNPRGSRIGLYQAELCLPGEDQVFGQGVIGCIAYQRPSEATLGTEESAGHAEVDGGVDPFVRIGRIVTAVLHQSRR